MSAPLRQTDFALISDGFRASSSAPLPAKTSAAPTPRGRASKASAQASISKPSASSESAALVGSLLRTALISELGELTPSSLRWRQSATPAGRLWYVLATSEPITSDPAPGSSGATLHRLPMSTPKASDMKAGGHGDTGRMGSVRHQLQEAMLATPRKTDADRGFRGDVLSQLNGYASRHAGMLHTPTVTANMHHPSMAKWPSCDGWAEIAAGAQETLPTPTKRDKRDKRMDAWSPAYDKRKSPTMDAVLDGAMTDRSPDKWAYARQIASLLSNTGLTGPSQTLPITYGWMMGYPPGWLGRALLSAMAKGSLLPASSSKRSATRSSRKSPRP